MLSKQCKIKELIKKETNIILENYQLGLYIGWMISFYCNTLENMDILFFIFDLLICMNFDFLNFKGERKENLKDKDKGKKKWDSDRNCKWFSKENFKEDSKGINFIEFIIAQNLIFFINAQSISKKNLQDNVYNVLKGFDVSLLKDFDFRIILKKSYLLFYKDIFLDEKRKMSLK